MLHRDMHKYRHSLANFGYVTVFAGACHVRRPHHAVQKSRGPPVQVNGVLLSLLSILIIPVTVQSLTEQRQHSDRFYPAQWGGEGEEREGVPPSAMPSEDSSGRSMIARDSVRRTLPLSHLLPLHLRPAGA